MAPADVTASPDRSPRLGLAFVFVTAFLDMLAFGIVVPVMPHLLLDLTGSAARTSEWIGVTAALFAAMQFVFMPIQGALSDRIGRRPVLLASSIGLCIQFVLIAGTNSVWVLLIARALAGATSANLGTVNAYVADITSKRDRARAMGMVGGAFGIGLIFGPALGSLLSGIETRLPFWVAAGLCAANVAYGALVLPESLPRARRTRRLVLADAMPLRALSLLRRPSALAPLVTVFLLLGVAQTALVTLFVLYASTELGWSVHSIGYALMGFGALSGIVQMVLTAPAMALVGAEGAVHAGLGIGAAGFVLLATAPGSWLIAIVPLLAFSFLAEGPLQAMMTAMVDETAQGRFQGALEASGSLTGVVGPLIFSTLFAFGVARPNDWAIPGLPFLVAAVCLAIGSIVLRATRSQLGRGRSPNGEVR